MALVFCTIGIFIGWHNSQTMQQMIKLMQRVAWKGRTTPPDPASPHWPQVDQEIAAKAAAALQGGGHQKKKRKKKRRFRRSVSFDDELFSTGEVLEKKIKIHRESLKGNHGRRHRRGSV